MLLSVVKTYAFRASRAHARLIKLNPHLFPRFETIRSVSPLHSHDTTRCLSLLYSLATPARPARSKASRPQLSTFLALTSLTGSTRPSRRTPRAMTTRCSSSTSRPLAPSSSTRTSASPRRAS